MDACEFFILIVLTIASSSSSGLEEKYCEIFQSSDYRGESLRVPVGHEISDFRRLTFSWKNGNKIRLLSFKILQANQDESICTLRGCTLKDFKGNCTTFKNSRKRVRGVRLSSINCKCRDAPGGKAPAIGTYNAEKSATENHEAEQTGTGCEDESVKKFHNFTNFGKKIVGIGRNYKWGRVDLSKSVEITSSPIVFLKPTTAYLQQGNFIHLPSTLGTIYYELELGVVIGKLAKNVTEDSAMDYVAGFALGFDMTAKDFLKSAISKGLPWEIGKGFDGSCPIGVFIPKPCIKDPHNLGMQAKLNGVVTQNDNTSGMIHRIPALIAYVSQFFSLEEGDLILTGTPDDFGAVNSGDAIEGYLEENGNTISMINFNIR